MNKQGIFIHKPIRTFLLFLTLISALAFFVYSVYKTAFGSRHLPSHTSTVHDRALRGEIVSADGYTLSRSSKTYKATVFTQSLSSAKLDLFITLFSIYSHQDRQEIIQRIKTHRGYTVLADNLDAATAVRLKSLAYKLRRLGVFQSIKNRHGADVLYGLDILESGEVRHFLLKDTLSPLLGYVRNTDTGRYKGVKGVKGLEKCYGEYLKHQAHGSITGMRDVAGTIIHSNSSHRKVRKNGMDLHLGIPLALQRRIELTLDKMKTLTQAKEIIAGIMESHTGKVLALASSERYDPEHITQKDVYSLNPKFSEFLYEPGSVMKPITLSIALKHHKVSPEEWIDTKGGKLKISSKYTISDDEVFDALTATDVIVHSSNVGISKIAWRLSGKTFYQGFKQFGFGSSSGIDLSRELVGKIKSQKQLSGKLHRANQAYGYGMMASFAQLWKAYSAFNNNGIALTPHIAAYLQDTDGKKYIPPSKVSNLAPINKQTALQIKKILQKVVTDGTGKAARFPGLEVGGKTGTAHIVKHGRYIDQYNSSFFGFVNDKKGHHYTIGVLAMGLKKKHMHFASQSAVPTFKHITMNLVDLGHLYPDLSLIQQQKIKAEEKKRKKAVKQRQQKRTRAIKSKLKRERDAILKKQRRKNKRKRYKKKVHIMPPASRKVPEKKHRPTPHEALPDLF